MSYSNDIKNQFIELRAQGLSLEKISEQIGVPKPTLGRWHHDHLQQIQRLRALQWDLLEDQIGHRLEETLTRIAQRIRKWEDGLAERKPINQKPIDIVRIIRESRREYLQLRSILLAPIERPSKSGPTVNSVFPADIIDPQTEQNRTEPNDIAGGAPSSSPTAGLTSSTHPSEKRDETRRNPEPPDPTSLQPNDLQQPAPPPSHSANGLVTPEVMRGHFSRQPSVNPNPQPADAVQSPELSAGALSVCSVLNPSGQNPDKNPDILSNPVNDSHLAPDSTPHNCPATSAVTPEVLRAEPRCKTDSKSGQISRQPFVNPNPQPADAVQDSETVQSKIQNPKSKMDNDDFLGSIVINPHECGRGVIIKWLEAERIHRERNAAP